MADRLIQHQLGLLGHPVKHSKSPQVHAHFAQQFGLNINYELIDVTEDNLATKFKNWVETAHGCNVTVPHKQAIMPLLDHCTQRAQLAQAVNTVFWRDGQLWGDNTDGDGLILDLKHKAVALDNRKVLIIGAGGATKGIIPSLLNQGLESITINNRDLEKAQELAAQYTHCYVAESTSLKAYDLIIHATSMGHQGLAPDLSTHLFHSDTVAYDLSYGEAAQPFLKAASVCGAKATYDGLGMLYGQAALAFEIWFNHQPTLNHAIGEEI